MLFIDNLAELLIFVRNLGYLSIVIIANSSCLAFNICSYACFSCKNINGMYGILSANSASCKNDSMNQRGCIPGIKGNETLLLG
jgi:hypothetical protein